MNRSWIAAGLVVIATIGWFASGLLQDEPAPAPPSRMRAEAGAAFLVEIVESTAQPVEEVLTLLGATEPARRITLRPRIAGTVVEIAAREGELVEAGQVIVRLDVEDRALALTRAEAALEQAEADYASAQSLSERGAVSATELRQRFTALQTARADLEAARIALANTEIVAPFDGVLDRRTVELGDRVSPEMADGIGTLIDISSLIVEVDVPQQSIGRVRRGQPAEVIFLNGQEATGLVTFVAASASRETRSFRAEITIPNEEARLPAGMSARAVVPTGTTEAHFVSPALLVLDDEGRLGVKTVDEASVVRFVPVEIVRGETEGMWVAGLPASARIITSGQGFVRAGETVRVTTGAMPETAIPVPPDAVAEAE